MSRRICTLATLVVLACVAVSGGQGQPDDESIWRTFMGWFRNAPAAGNPLAGHAAALEAEGVAKSEIERRMGIVTRLLNDRYDWVELYFDKVFTRPITGKPARDGFSTAPTELVVESAKGLGLGTALDAGMGQGRNAIYLARQGWSVTGFDISGEAVAAASKNAREAGTRLEAIKASYADFDFGEAKWDLIVLVFAWAPVTDPAFVARLQRSLRADGRIVFEHLIDDPEEPRPPAIHALKPGQLRELFKDFRIDRYEEVDGVGDWGGPGSRLVRMVAVNARKS